MNIENLLNNQKKYKTPAILYDLDQIEKIINTIESDSKGIENIEFLFSIKANRFLKVLEKIKEKNWGIDISSIKEFEIAKKVGFKKIYATSPSFKKNDLDYLYSENIIPDFNSISQIESWCGTNKNCVKKDIGLRIKIPISSKLKHSTISDENSRFGINLSENYLYKLIKEKNLEVKQIHFHLGEIRNSQIIKEVIIYLNKIINIFPKLKSINFGGGFTYLYSNRYEVLKFWNYIKIFSEDLSKCNKNIKFIFEPGMLITVSSGVLLTEVIYADKLNNKINLIVDSSAWALFTWSPIKIITQIPNRQGLRKNYMITGSSCYEEDIFLKQIELNEVKIGDKICFAYSGAYVSSMMLNMHGHDTINEYIL
ncbi:TPA: hypothetical protein ACOTG0_003083 [Clostridium perfringens]